MNFDRDSSNTDEYFMTAVQIFDCCGVESSGALRVDALMHKFAPFVKTNKADFSYLSTLMDPEQCNPEINVTKLANALHKYSESQKSKVDLDESFNLKGGQAPQDSDSGISSDGLQILEELQGELKEKEHLAHQLRSQLDFSDRQHEEALAAITAERDTLKRHLNIVREENASLSHLRRDYDESCERLAISEAALATARSELDTLRRRAACAQDRLATIEGDKLTLQELLSASKDECHRINEMYAARQSALLEENETLKTEHADLASRLQDQEDFMQQIIKEKVHLEMELKDMLNKSNQTHLRLDRSIDVSYTEDQMLTALDSLNADSRFAPDHRLLDEESFNNALKEDQGRATNMSLFDEIRFSFCNMTNFNLTDKNILDHSMSNNSVATAWTQTDEGFNDINLNDVGDKAYSSVVSLRDKCQEIRFEDASDIITVAVETQTDELQELKPYVDSDKFENKPDIAERDKLEIKVVGVETQTDACDNLLTIDKNKVEHVNTGTQTIGAIVKNRPLKARNMVPNRLRMRKSVETQTTFVDMNFNNNSHVHAKCIECENANKTDKLVRDVKCSNLVLSEIQIEIAKYEDNLMFLEKLIDEGKDKNKILLSVVEDLNIKIGILESAYEKQKDMLNNILTPDVCCVDCQTDFDQSTVSTQAEVPCLDCEKRKSVGSHRTLRRFFWDPLKCLFQVFAVICFICAVCLLCGLLGRGGAGCRAAPWRWMHAQELMDLLLRIEYTAEVPM